MIIPKQLRRNLINLENNNKLRIVIYNSYNNILEGLVAVEKDKHTVDKSRCDLRDTRILDVIYHLFIIL